jgi:uncharacterized membrane protein
MNKKYISLLGILLMVFAINISQAKAEYGFSGNVSAQVGNDGTTTVNVDGIANPATGGVMPIKGQIKLRKDENKKIREDFKDDRKELRDDIKEDRQEMKDASGSEKGLLKQDIEDKRDEIKDKKEEAKKEIRQNIEMNLVQRTENLTKIAERVKVRIAKVKARGIDMTIAADLEAKAEVSIAQAKELSLKVKASIDSGASKEEIKANIKAVKDALKQAHTYLEQSVKEIKSKVEAKTPKAEDSSRN